MSGSGGFSSSSSLLIRTLNLARCQADNPPTAPSEIVGPLLIGSSPIPLIELLEWNETGLVLNNEALAHCATEAEDLQSGNKRVQSSTLVRDDNKLFTKLKVGRVQRRLEALAGQHPNLNKEQLAKKLAKAGMGEGMSAERIERVTRVPARK